LARQHDVGGSHITLADEVEHGLEPHRIARLLKHLGARPVDDESATSQIFMTTHSPVVIRELKAADLFAVRSDAGTTSVKSVTRTARETMQGHALRERVLLLRQIQGHLRRSPDAFLARKVIVGEGRTEQGLLRGLDAFWTSNGKHDSFALRGAITIDGGGNADAPAIAGYLLALGYAVFLLLDTDRKADAALVASVRTGGGTVHEWADDCSTEQRIFFDVPWVTVAAIVNFAAECVTADSVLYNINKACGAQGMAELADLALPVALDTRAFRSALGKAAKNESTPWFKDITRGESVGDLVGKCLNQISATPLAKGLHSLRQWVDG
jgi:putative ATP-dependent endonuclease of OLD family